MSLSRKEIDEKYLKEHSELEMAYYKRREMTKEEFDAKHGGLWKRHEEELIQHGHRKRMWTYSFLRKGAKKKDATESLSFTFDYELSSTDITNIESDYNCIFDSVTIGSVDLK